MEHVRSLRICAFFSRLYIHAYSIPRTIFLCSQLSCIRNARYETAFVFVMRTIFTFFCYVRAHTIHCVFVCCVPYVQVKAADARGPNFLLARRAKVTSAWPHDSPIRFFIESRIRMQDSFLEKSVSDSVLRTHHTYTQPFPESHCLFPPFPLLMLPSSSSDFLNIERGRQGGRDRKSVV